MSVVNLGVEVSLVIGGGNIFRGNMAESWGIERAEADNIRTLATVINSLMLRGVLKAKSNKEVRVMTAIPITSVAEPYIRLWAVHHLEKGYIVIFAGGNGQPYVTTDYPSVQRAIEVNCDAMDHSAFILARDYNLPMHVFNFDKRGSMKEICEGKDNGTIISGELH